MDGNLVQQLLDLDVIGTSSHPLAVLLVLQAADALLTLGHSLQELRGRLWDYFGAIAGVRIPTWVGRVFFFGGLTIGLWLIASVGICLAALWPHWSTMGALGILIGSRVGDGIFSHLWLHVRRYRPNPGLTSVPLYFAEALLLIAIFRGRLVTFTWPAGLGFAFGVTFFYGILPSLTWFGHRHWPPRDRWRPGTPRPS